MDFKKVISILTLSLSLHILAQDTPGNLQFNRVVVYNSESNPGTPSPAYSPSRVAEFDPITIPNGKVWKIESVAMYNRLNQRHSNIVGHAADDFGAIEPNFNNEEKSLQLDDIPIYISFYSTGGDFVHKVKYPIWLPSGTYRPHSWEPNVGSEFTIYALEFNIIP